MSLRINVWTTLAGPPIMFLARALSGGRVRIRGRGWSMTLLALQVENGWRVCKADLKLVFMHEGDYQRLLAEREMEDRALYPSSAPPGPNPARKP